MNQMKEKFSENDSFSSEDLLKFSFFKLHESIQLILKLKKQNTLIRWLKIHCLQLIVFFYVHQNYLMNSFLFLLAFSPLLFIISLFSLPFPNNSLLLDATTYYVNEESVAAPETGSLTHPFTSIAQAYSSLGAITCDLVLLGSSASISTSISFATGANYIIRYIP